MTKIPRSRSVSRSGTPGLTRGVPAKLKSAPTLHPSPSVSSLNIHSYYNLNQATVQMDVTHPSSPPTGDHLDSSASSVINMDPAEGLLIQDVDTDTDVEDLDSARPSTSHSIDRDDQKRDLREQLKRSLSERVAVTAELARPRQEVQIQDLYFESVSLFFPREYFVLTTAGKPVFVSRPGPGDQSGMASAIGIMQALISVFLDDNDKLRSINAGRTRITFLLRPPLYYVCASSWGEPESVTRSHLEYLHLQILSIVSGSQLKRIFERRTNFDLRRLLDGAEVFLSSLLQKLESDISMSLSALHCLKVEPFLRKRIAESLIPNSKLKANDLLYVILIARNRVVTLIRPRRHSIHPADIHIIVNTITSPSVFNSPAAASWIPICLPKFNLSGFLNMYITFLRKEEPLHSQDVQDGNVGSSQTGAELDSVHQQNPNHLNDCGIALVCVSGGGDFDMIRSWCDSAIQRMSTEGTLSTLVGAHQEKKTEYSVSELGIPGLRHFVYKSRAHVQITHPTFEEPYDQSQSRKRIVTLYQVLHDSIHAKSGQEGGLKLQYLRTNTESVMGWITQPFELYIALSPLLPKSAAVGAANAVARWIKKEEARLFLKDAPIF